MSSLLRRINPPKKLNILCSPTHEGYQSNLAKTGHNFYMLSGHGLKKWDFYTRPLPQNHYIFEKDYNSLNADVSFDLLLSQERHFQLPLFRHIHEKTGIPLIHLDHTEPKPEWNEKQFAAVTGPKAHKHVYITEHNRGSWKDPGGTVIPHGVDTAEFSGYSGELPVGLSVVNFFPQRDVFCGWNIWNQIKGNGNIPVDLVGENPGLSKSAGSLQELISEYARHRFYLNTSILSPVPLSLLEAMACGCPAVSTAKQQIPSIIMNGKNGFISNDIGELIESCRFLINNKESAREMGEAGRKTIIEKFGMPAFIANWNKIFYSTIEEFR